MVDHAHQLPEALVLRWNGETLRTRCPFCLYSHRHSLEGLSRTGNADQGRAGWRLRREHGSAKCSDCADGGNYQLAFPESNPNFPEYGWELDREACEFVAVDCRGTTAIPLNDSGDGRRLLPQYEKPYEMSNACEDDEDEVEELVAATNNVDIEDDERPDLGRTIEEMLEAATEAQQERYRDPGFRRTAFFSHCILRETEDLDRLCQKYPGDQYTQCVDEEGNTGALFAATEEDAVDTLRCLCHKGHPLDVANNYGRTPVMEAALWGRRENVEYLVQQGVDTHARDGNGMNAADLSADWPRNADERATRSGDVHREPANAYKRREQIRALLKRLSLPTPGQASSGPVSPRRAFFHRMPDGTLELYRPQTTLQPPSGPYGLQLQKAFATLDRGSNYPYINAMSGYSHSGWPNVLDNQVWTDKADNLRAVLGLPKNRSAASHVESQLLAYLLERNSLYMFDNVGHREGLISVLPLYTLRPVITVSKLGLCSECHEFFERFKVKFPGFNVIFDCVGE